MSNFLIEGNEDELSGRQEIDHDLYDEDTLLFTANPGGGFGSGTVKNSDDSYVATVSAGATLVLPDSIITNSDGTYSLTLPATNDKTLPDITIQSSSSNFSTAHPGMKNYTIPDVDWTDSDGTSQSTEYGQSIVCSQDKHIVAFFAIDNNICEFTINTDRADTYTISSSSNVGTLTVEVKPSGGSYATDTTPFTFSNGDTVKLTRTTTASEGEVNFIN